MTDPSLDSTVLEGLRQTLDDDGLLADLMHTFLGETPAHLAELTSAQQRGDHASLAATAHLVRGSALTFGATRLATLCATMEASPLEAGGILPALEREYVAVSAALTDYLGRMT